MAAVVTQCKRLWLLLLGLFWHLIALSTAIITATMPVCSSFRNGWAHYTWKPCPATRQHCPALNTRFRLLQFPAAWTPADSASSGYLSCLQDKYSVSRNRGFEWVSNGPRLSLFHNGCWSLQRRHRRRRPSQKKYVLVRLTAKLPRDRRDPTDRLQREYALKRTRKDSTY